MRVSISRRVRTAKTPLPVHVGVVRDLCAGGHYRDARSRPWTRPVSRFRPLYSSVASRSRPRRPLPRHSAVALGWRGLRSRSPPSDPVVQPLRCPRAGSGPRSALPAVARVLGPGPPGSAGEFLRIEGSEPAYRPSPWAGPGVAVVPASAEISYNSHVARRSNWRFSLWRSATAPSHIQRAPRSKLPAAYRGFRLSLIHISE